MFQGLQDVFRLQAFVTVVEEGSLSAAVKKLHVTQPALSTRIRLLEESLNSPLLERTARGVKPTPVGKIVYSISKDILERMNALNISVKNQLDLESGDVHMAGDTTAVIGVYPSLMEAFIKEYPNIHFSLRELNAAASVQAVKDGVADIAVFVLPLMTETLEKELLSDVNVEGFCYDELAFVVSKDHLLAKGLESIEKTGKKLLPIHLQQQHFILPTPGESIREMVLDELRKFHVKPHVCMTLKTTQSAMQMVSRGIGVSVVDRLALCPWGNFKELQIEGINLKRKVVIISTKNRMLPPSTQSFLNLTLHQAKKNFHSS